MTKLADSGKRSFTVVNAMHADGCATKFNENSRLTKRHPQQAASSAFTRLCNLKRVKGGCALFVTVKETTQGSAGKEHTYKCMRKKLDKPIELKGRVIEYMNTCHAVKSTPACARSRKSSGPMLSRSRRQTKKH
jgi:hypothetical protein